MNYATELITAEALIFLCLHWKIQKSGNLEKNWKYSKIIWKKIWKNSENSKKKSQERSEKKNLLKSKNILNDLKKYVNNLIKVWMVKREKFLVFYCDFAPFDVSWVFRSCIQRNGWPACLLSTKSYTQQASHFFHAFMHLSSDISFFEMPAFSIQD